MSDQESEKESICCVICEVKLTLACGDAVTTAFNPRAIPPVSGGVTCRVDGNYGSTAFDPTGGDFLRFFMCDECLIKKHS